MTNARIVIQDWIRSVPINDVLQAQQDDFRNWTPEICDGVINYEIVTEDDRVFLVRTWRPRAGVR